MTEIEIEAEQGRRKAILEAYNIDTEGFEILNTFFLADVVLNEQTRFTNWLIDRGYFKLASLFRRLKVEQSYDPRFKRVFEIV